MYRHSEYAKLSAQKKLWPIDPEVEQDWSGRGQHAEFQKDEQKLINEVLEVQDNLEALVLLSCKVSSVGGFSWPARPLLAESKR
jgi:hypothetical protein